MFGQSLAFPEIDEETATQMATKIREAIAIAHHAGYQGGAIGDLIHGITYLTAWNTTEDNNDTQKDC